ncbi:Oxidoreductase [Hyphodiscus hymeniophilus]|uniref:Oxidoreductase n=1 Tax=Hyphodiscus hymeniophilus TaxID=353542 RepID=A0A9P6VLU1_9HELO|nr:Oxidoreductase [Hyphodiscus hymeniophilus]
MSITTETVTSTASRVQLSPKNLGIARITDSPEGSLEIVDRLLQTNHDHSHVYWRDVGGHNHISHSVLSVLALGGGPTQLQRAYDDGIDIQRPIPPLDQHIVKGLGDPDNFLAQIGNIDQYTNFLRFFEQKIAAEGWKAVVQEYLFSRTPIAEKLFAQLYEGAFHPFIHVGLGIEFEQSSIIAEGLAQAATHDSARIDVFFHRSEELAANSITPSKTLVQLLLDIRADDKLHYAARLPDGPVRVRDGVLGRAGEETASLAAQFHVKPEDLERATAEAINVAAYTAGAAQRAGKARKIDFFHMHNVTSSLFLTVFINQPWISAEDKVRIVERKARLDLVWYAASSAAELHIEDVTNYKATKSAGLDWSSLYRLVNDAHDDGHVAKFVRALKNGEEVSKRFEQGGGSEAFPIRGDSWLKIAQMSYDSTLDVGIDDKWIWGVGFDPLWARIPALD